MTPALSFALHLGSLPRWGIGDKNARTKKPEERFLNKRSSGLQHLELFRLLSDAVFGAAEQALDIGAVPPYAHDKQQHRK